jgi:poly(A) polymerase
MSPFLRPPLPTALAGLDPVWVGTAARMGRSRAVLQTRAEVMVEADLTEVLAVAAGLVEDPVSPGTVLVGDVRVLPVEGDIETALCHRVLPVDAIGVRATGEVIDPLGGVDQLAREELVVPDALLAQPGGGLRAVAVASELAAHIEAETVARITGRAHSVFAAPRPLVRDALTQALVGQRPAEALQLLHTTGHLRYLLPEVAALVGFHKSSRYHHKDVWEHTKQVVQQAIPSPIIRWAALLHDIGKTHTRSFEPGGKVHFLRHDDLGAYMCEGITSRLLFAADDSARVERLVLYHQRPGMYTRGWTDSAVRRFAAETRDVLHDLLHLARADVTTKRARKRRSIHYNLFELRARIDEVRAQDEARRPLVPKGLGRHIIDQLGISAGPKVGELRRLCEAAIRAGELAPKPDVATCIAYLRGRIAP